MLGISPQLGDHNCSNLSPMCLHERHGLLSRKSHTDIPSFIHINKSRPRISSQLVALFSLLSFGVLFFKCKFLALMFWKTTLETCKRCLVANGQKLGLTRACSRVRSPGFLCYQAQISLAIPLPHLMQQKHPILWEWKYWKHKIWIRYFLMLLWQRNLHSCRLLPV